MTRKRRYRRKRPSDRVATLLQRHGYVVVVGPVTENGVGVLFESRSDRDLKTVVTTRIQVTAQVMEQGVSRLVKNAVRLHEFNRRKAGLPPPSHAEKTSTVTTASVENLTPDCG